MFLPQVTQNLSLEHKKTVDLKKEKSFPRKMSKVNMCLEKESFAIFA